MSDPRSFRVSSRMIRAELTVAPSGLLILGDISTWGSRPRLPTYAPSGRLGNGPDESTPRSRSSMELELGEHAADHLPILLGDADGTLYLLCRGRGIGVLGDPGSHG